MHKLQTSVLIKEQRGNCDSTQQHIKSSAMSWCYFYHATHFSAERGIEIACRLSVRLSVCL